MRKIITLTILTVAMIAILLAGCGSNQAAPGTTSPTTVTAPVAPTSPRAINVSVTFPPSPVTSPAALISASTKSILVTIKDGATGAGVVLASSSIVAPVGGGSTTATIMLTHPMATTSYAGPIYINAIAKDSAGTWRGEVELTNKYLNPGGIATLKLTMLEGGQGVVIPLTASSPVLLSPDGSTYTITKVIAVATPSLGVNTIWSNLLQAMSNGPAFSIGIEALVTPVNTAILPYTIQSFSSATNTYAYLSDNILSVNVIVRDPQIGPTVPPQNIYQLNLSGNPLSQMPNNFTVSAIISTGGGGTWGTMNFPAIGTLQNDIANASTGVALVIQ